ncbi:MAG TPA: (Fe-S)-binding protein [Acidimicrobiales bacterium]|nr:(Fe-S)-binding protein [Acidimicrobiales bacterium]
MDLGIDDDDLATCVACGLCLPHCPTYRVTGEEALSPRGRVAAMRQVQWEGADVDPSFLRSMETCVQCRGCETACPSGVPFGRLVEPTRAALAEGPPPAGEPVGAPRPSRAAHRGAPGLGRARRARRRPLHRPPLALRAGLRALRHHRLLLVGSTALAWAQRLRILPATLSRRLGLPARLPLRRPRLRPSGTDVWLFTGCVMDAWMRDVHADVQRVVEAAGAGVALPGPGASCCGALALHAGLASEARRLARRTMAALPGDAPVLVDSAGCGAMLRDYGHVLGTEEARAFSTRVRDVHEWLAEHVGELVAAAGPGPAGGGGRPVVTVQDPCHLRHVQRAHASVRTVLSPFATLVELDDDGLCCGAGGAYALAQPELAGAIRARKVAAVERVGRPLVASANPGCALHLSAAGLDVVHPCTVVARALDGPLPAP